MKEALLQLSKQRFHGLSSAVAGYVRIYDGAVVPVPQVDLEIANPDFPGWFFGVASQLLVYLGGRLRVCEDPACRWLFLPIARQVYCSRTCSQRVCAETFRKAHPERVRATQKRAYHRRKEAKLGRTGDAGSRPRKKISRRSASRGK